MAMVFTASTGNCWHWLCRPHQTSVWFSRTVSSFPDVGVQQGNGACKKVSSFSMNSQVFKKAVDECLLWASLVSHLFIAPLSLISGHRLFWVHALPWLEPLSSVNTRSCLISFPAASMAALFCYCITGCCRPKHLLYTTALCQNVSFKVQQFMANVFTSEGKCALVTLLHVSVCQLVLMLE